MNLKNIELKRDVDLKKFNTYKVGGKASLLIIANSTKEVGSVIKDYGFNLYILGGGSNLLINDGKITTPILKLGQGFNRIRRSDDYVEVGGSTSLSSLLKFCLKNNFGGIENLAGIPGTIGGLIRMNASSFGTALSSYLVEVDTIDERGNTNTFRKNDIFFGYRYSSLKNVVILKARFKFLSNSCLRRAIKNIILKRYDFQDYSYPSCGSVFKNPPDVSAGYLIDSSGLKGIKYNDAQISHIHANYIINRGSAKYEDIDFLIQKIKKTVLAEKCVELEEEVIRWT
ncbi:MAG: UDP-N-acetylmuramate dehydrogenase [Candidatus Omnitrophica bacterium]|nr:UDP-N-acetylmuramate dehydrogenase [Candidatus Omnitrophota bacterium]